MLSAWEAIWKHTVEFVDFASSCAIFFQQLCCICSHAKKVEHFSAQASVCVCVLVYMIYGDTTLHNDIGITWVLQRNYGLFPEAS